MSHFSIIHEHFASERDCMVLAKLFPNEVWPLCMMLRAKNDDELKAIADKQEEKKIARIAQNTLYGYQIRHG